MAVQDPGSPATAEHDPVEVMKRFLERMSDLDVAGASALFHDEIRFEHMFVPGGDPMIVTSAEDLTRSLADTLARFETWSFRMTGAYRVAGDPHTVITEWESVGELKSRDEYRNRYIGIHRVVDGKIAFWREFADPTPMQLVWTEDAPRLQF